MRSPLLGYNHNLKYRGRVYHIQTEDSGEANPHIFTHLFHNGIIISTRKTEYGHLLGAEDVEDQVRKMMQLQHKDMMKGLLGGQFDDKIVRYFGTLQGDEVPEKSDREAATTAPPPETQSAPRKPAKSASGSSFVQEDTLLGFGQPPAAAGKTTTTTLKEQSVSALGPAPAAAGDLPRTRPVPTTPEPGKTEPSVVIARPAIILTGDENTGFGSFAAPQPQTRPSMGKSRKAVDPFEVPDTLLDISPAAGSSSSRGANEKTRAAKPETSEIPSPVPAPPLPPPPPPTDMRLTGPIQAPPGLFKPEDSKEIPEDLVRLNSADTRVDDIILDFLMAESLSKLDEGDEKP